MGKFLFLVQRFIGLAALMAGLSALVLSALMLGGLWSADLDAFTHFAPLLLALTLVAAALALGATPLRRRQALTIALLPALTCGLLMGPEAAKAAMQAARPASGPGLKIVQFNLWGRNADPEGTAAWILAERPDVIVLQEAFGHAERTRQILQAAYPHHSPCPSPESCDEIVLSRLPMTAGGFGRLPPRAWAQYRWRDRTVTVVGAHFAWPLPPELQQAQQRNLATMARGLPREHLIVAGDFNSTPWSFALRRTDRAMGLERRTRMVWSWPAQPQSRARLGGQFPLVPIDHVYAGKGWRTVSVRRGPKLGSDHYPVVVELAPR